MGIRDGHRIGRRVMFKEREAGVVSGGTVRMDMSIGTLFFQAEDGIRNPLWSRGLGDVYKRQTNAFNFQQGVSKIRTSSHPGTTRIDHSDPPTRFRPQCREAGCPFFPKLGQQPFRYSATTVFGNLTQRGCHRPHVRLRFYRWQENCASARITLNCYKNPTRGLDVDYP